ncbi:uncharacterized protein LOC107493906 [Arachis duranensis]|uniref:Uncharacterized protein LOC107493906 n=1 Tax=Arachis duranensis TaxID=130453 RepID=A0A6P4DSM0_ARADU|nr:uncharacterized protein LOC107493906 [Arachis duranensis]
MATMNDVAEVVREAAVGAARAVECLGVRNGDENGYGEDNGNDENNLGHPERPMTLVTFLKVNPPKFKGTLIATDADNWFRGIERSLRAQHVPEGQHVELLLICSRGKLSTGGRGYSDCYNIMKMTFLRISLGTNFIKSIFREQHEMLGEGATRDAKEMELMQLRQGDMTVAEYARNFDDLCCFSKICQGDSTDLEEWKCLKFEGGLCVDLMSSIVLLEIRNFAESVNKSKLVEECIKKVTVAKVSRQGFPPRRLSNHQIAGRRVHFKARGIRQCKNLQVGNITDRRMEHDSRSCQFGSPNCYACRELGHIAKDCPKGFTRNPVSTQQQGRVFAITIDNVVQSNTLIQEVIRGLDLLSKYHVFLDFLERTVVIPSDSLDIKPFLSHTLYLNSVRVTLGGSDCEGYVLLAASSNDSELSLERIRVAKEFPDVFPDDIPEFPPQTVLN